LHACYGDNVFQPETKANQSFLHLSVAPLKLIPLSPSGLCLFVWELENILFVFGFVLMLLMLLIIFVFENEQFLLLGMKL
jgi:hypothetical protein